MKKFLKSKKHLEIFRLEVIRIYFFGELITGLSRALIGNLSISFRKFEVPKYFLEWKARRSVEQ